MIRNKGAPGGCGTCCQIAAEVNSPQSQKGIEVWAVKIYVILAVQKAIKANILWICLLSM